MQRKAELLEAARFQTQDYQQTVAAADNAKNEMERLQAERQEWQTEHQSMQNKFNEEQASIAELNQEVARKEADLERERNSGESS